MKVPLPSSLYSGVWFGLVPSFSYLTHLAKKQGLLGFTGEVLMDNRPMLHLCQKMGLNIEKTFDHGVYELKMMFRKK